MLIYGFDCETTGLSPVEHEVITVQYATEDGELTIYRQWDYADEAAMLVDFLGHWAEIRRKRDADGALFVGYNHLKFDVPFVFARCLLDERILESLSWTPAELWRQLYRWPMYLDLVHLLGSDFIAMSAVRETLVGTTDPIASRDIPVLYANGDYDRIETYVEDEMAALAAIFEALRAEPLFDELLELRRRAGYERPLS